VFVRLEKKEPQSLKKSYKLVTKIVTERVKNWYGSKTSASLGSPWIKIKFLSFLQLKEQR
jgi:hypothetical protein